MRIATKFIKGDIYEIGWTDVSFNQGWRDGKDLEPRIVKCKSVGFFVSENSEAICLSLSKSEGDKETAQYADTISIPRVNIISVRALN